MGYASTKAPAIDTSGDVTKLTESVVNLAKFVDDEFKQVQTNSDLGLLQFDPKFVVPIKPRTGMLAYADGAHWNPGNGEGLYQYTSSGLWVPAFTVIPFTLPLSSANGGTGVTSPTAHTIPINEGSSPQNNTGVGSAGQFLGSNGAGNDPSFKTASMQLLETLTPSNVATIQTSISWAGFSSIELVFENVIPVTNAVFLIIQNVTAGGVQSSGYSTQYVQSQSTTTTSAVSAVTAGYTVGNALANTASLGCSGTMRIYNIAGAGQKHFTSDVFLPALQRVSAAGTWTGGAAVTGGVFSMSSGNISSGVIKAYGIL